MVNADNGAAYLDLRGLKCPLPVLRARKALGFMSTGALLVVETTDPMSAIDIPHMVRETQNELVSQASEDGVLRFEIRKG